MKPTQTNLFFRFFSSNLSVCAVLVTATLFVYANALFNPFIWDDHGLIIGNPLIKSFGNVAQIFQSNVLGGRGESFYRPLQMLSYALDYQLWGLNPVGFHLTNALLHAASGIVLFFLIDALFFRRGVSFLTALFFLVHPVQTESVVYISSRADLLAAFFMLLACLCYKKYLDQSGRHLLGAACVFAGAALLTKEYALITPALFALVHLSDARKSSWAGLIPVGLMAAIYAAARFGVEVSGAVKTTLAQRLPGVFIAFFEYVRLLIWPQDLHMGYGLKIFSWMDWRVWAGLVILGMVCWGGIKHYRHRLVFFSCAWFLAALLPVVNLYPMNAYMAEHWLYVASIGFFTGLSLITIGAMSRWKYAAVAVVLAMTAIYAGLTVRQNLLWREPAAFYQRIIRLNPSFIEAYNNLGAVYAQEGKWREAGLYFKKALELKPSNPEALSNLARIEQQLGRDEAAMRLIQQAQDPSVFDSETLNNQGLAMYHQGKTREAEQLYRRAIAARATNKEALNNLANVLLEQGSLEEARKHYEQALSVDPFYVEALNNLGFLYSRLGDGEKAREYYIKALELKPEYIEANNNLGLLYFETGEDELAMAHLGTVLSQDPGNLDALNVLGVIYGKRGAYEMAEEAFTKVLRIKPDYVSAIKNLSKVKEMKAAAAKGENDR